MKRFVCLFVALMAMALIAKGDVEIRTREIMMIVSDPPVVTGATPSEQKVLTGDPFTFSITATGDPELTYQWMYNGTDIPGATGAALTVASAILSNAGDYICRVTSGKGYSTDSLKGALSVDQRLMFTEHPSDANIIVGNPLILQAEAVGVGAIAYHWEKDGADVLDATTRILYIASLSAGDAGSYVCQATDSRDPAQTTASNAGVVTVSTLPPTLALVHADAALDMTATFNSNGAPLSSVCAETLPGAPDWANITAMGIDFVNKSTWDEVLEGHAVTVTPGVDTAAITFTGLGVDWGGSPAQVADPLTLVGLDCYILPWFEVSTDPGTRYFFNPNVVKAALNGADLTQALGLYLLHITN